MIKYDPNNELSKEELSKLDFDMFLNYIDQKAEYLKQFTRPINSYETKKYATISNARTGEELTSEKFDRIKCIAKMNDNKLYDRLDEIAFNKQIDKKPQ